MTEENITPVDLTPEAAVKLVDELAEIRAEKKLLVDRLDQRAEKIREALAIYSGESGNDTIAGTDFLATVSHAVSLRIPKAGSEQRLELESQLKNLGLWKDVDMLSSSKLKKRIDSIGWTQEQREEITRYVDQEEKVKIALKKSR